MLLATSHYFRLRFLPSFVPAPSYLCYSRPSYIFIHFEAQSPEMKSHFVLVLLGVLALGVNGLAPQQQYLITYPKDSPQSDLDDYKHAIAVAGGQILHEFQLIK